MIEVVLDGTCTLESTIDGSCALTSMLAGEAVAVLKVNEVTYYTGDYSITPTADGVTIPIEQLTASQDIVIEPIPSNYGLITWDGSTLTVS